MNNARRNKMRRIIEHLNAIEPTLQSILDDEQNARDNLPESQEDSDRASSMDEAIEALEEAMDYVDFSDLISALENAIDC